MIEEEQSRIMEHFVLQEPRAKQITAVQYLEKKYLDGFRHIVLAAPTGCGKSGIGATACFWSQELEVEGFSDGGYYLVTQKLLQDQLKEDFRTYRGTAGLSSHSIKSASEYLCTGHGNCALGMSSHPKCGNLRTQTCTYIRQRNLWISSKMSVTNYPYLFTEHAMAGQLPPRKVLVLDECHTLERQILRFVEATISQDMLRKWTPTIKVVPDFDTVEDFADFLLEDYLPILFRRLEALQGWEPSSDSEQDKKIAQEKLDLENHYGRTFKSATRMLDDPENWVFWQEKDSRGDMAAMAKPLDAASFSQDLIFEMGHVCVHMSAYPGSKRVYCKNLGLVEDKVAWLNLNSTFPVSNREIFISPVGSMSKRNREQTMPELLEFIDKVMESYPADKGIIHCNSYELGRAIHAALKDRPQGKRIIFPKSAEDRDPAFMQHKMAKFGSVMLSPSVTEGFDFANDLARWQVIAKVPYPYLGDRQVAAKKEISQEWYDLQAVSSIIQACGRIVRSDTDVGHTYILDSDFLGLWEKCADMFPRWWTDAVVWPRR